MFWNEEGKIVRARKYGKIQQSSYETPRKVIQKKEEMRLNNMINDNPFA
jgi:hypothetical protein